MFREQDLSQLFHALCHDSWRINGPDLLFWEGNDPTKTSLTLSQKKEEWRTRLCKVHSSLLLKEFLHHQSPIKSGAASNRFVPCFTVCSYEESEIERVLEDIRLQAPSLFPPSEDALAQGRFGGLLSRTEQSLQMQSKKTKQHTLYALSADVLLSACDLPQLVYLTQVRNLCREAFPVGKEENIFLEDPEFHDILSSCSPSIFRSNPPPFGISFRGNSLVNCTHLQMPAFCSAGRKEAFCRLIAMRGRKKNVHAFQYHIQKASTPHPLSGDVFCNETAWYFEMCTGVCLTAGLTSLFLQLQHECDVFYDSFLFRHSHKTWGDCMEEIFLSLLRAYQPVIIRCPAVYWRVAYLRESFRKLNQLCLSLETLIWDVPYLAGRLCDPSGFGIPLSLGCKIPENQADWAVFAENIFSSYARALQFDAQRDSASLPSADILEQFLHHMNIRFPPHHGDLSFSELVQILCAKTGPFPPKAACCLGYAILPNEPGIRALQKSFRKYTSKSSRENAAREKIRNRSQATRLYGQIHKILYSHITPQSGAQLSPDPGFFDFPCT